MTDLDHHSSRPSAQVSGDDSSGDDIWDESDAVSYDRTIAEREWSRLHDTFGSVRVAVGEESTAMPWALRYTILTLQSIASCRQDIERALKKERKAHCNKALIKAGQKACNMDMNWEDFEA